MGILRTQWVGSQNPAWRGGRREVPCESCGKTVIRSANELRKAAHTFCSYQCKYDYDHTVTVLCTTCGNALKRNPAFAQRSPHHFCNLTCRGIFQSKSKTIVKTPCLICGEDVTWARPSKNASFCSRKCYAAWQAQHRTGKNASNWKGGYQSYYGPNWRAQQRAARKRDGYKCQHCGVAQTKKRALDVHHIKPFRTFGYMPGINENHRQANDLTNLISLCKGCHKLAEHGKIAIQPYLL
jgi:endogenous inhibitor of DNA gyrase (YacG/DUF329 family)